jgi:rhamnosyltransferase
VISSTGVSDDRSSVRAPRVAICLAACNGMPWLAQQIDSIMTQDGVEARLYVSVDVSSDGTLAYVQDLCSRNPAISLLPYGERYGSAARNSFSLLRTVDFSDSDFVALADQDDIWVSSRLLRAVSELGRRQADVYASNVMAFWESGREAYIDKSQPQREWDFLFEAGGPGCTYVMRSEVACRLQACLRAESRAVERIEVHDWLVYAFARANGFAWIIDDFPGVRYRQHATNALGVNLGLRAFAQRASRLLDGWGFAQAQLIAQTVGLGSAPFVLRWRDRRRRDFVWLALQAAQCRRRRRDRVLFALLCLTLAVLGAKR